MLTSVVDRHCFDVNPDPDSDPNVLVDADPDPDPDPDWQKNNVGPHADPTQSFTQVGKSDFFTFGHSIATLQCFIFLISVKCVICFRCFRKHIEISWKKVFFSFA